MKTYIIGIACILIFSGFCCLQMMTDKFIEVESSLKSTANNSANIAALYYNEDEYAEGNRVFNKEEGNKAILFTIKENLKLNNDMTFKGDLLPDVCHYTVYYFDEIGKMSKYQDDSFINTETITFPYEFVEEKSNYKKTISKATIIVTIDAGRFDYPLVFIQDPKLVRTSAYEYKGF